MKETVSEIGSQLPMGIKLNINHIRKKSDYERSLFFLNYFF
jgi:hypothetical protein